ncbi:response regulator transcription factor [Siphonobacter sp. SORGH_AS_1065]|uniref:response regulator transcription factor n=1 Tax=Siphonobacter sp. SORGH_AS_1065 TaxID=3041795 RepID=UPI00278996C0|nr:response regulator transcription factor [Siphonobacter sp. SORGH_AS_1065]MDQ1085596.1 two-component system invasion response regulator UvrY [Siphonobacter sp. SORGH_AS_1065]
MLRILIVDDHSIVRLGTKHLIKSILSDSIIVECENFKQVIATLKNQKFDFVVLDINIPGGNSIGMISILKRINPSLKIMVFSSYDERLYALPYIKAGADGFLSKEASNVDFEIAVKTIINNKKYLSDKVKDEGINRLLNGNTVNTNSLELLSNREKEIVQLLVDGKSTSEIANTLNIHISTVSTHKAKIFEKLNVTNTLQLSKLIQLSN